VNLEILKTLNAERAARRAVAVVTDQASGAQRAWSKAVDAGRDPLGDLIEQHSPIRQRAG
jgi:xanthine dehydrogenase accessory factor